MEQTSLLTVSELSIMFQMYESNLEKTTLQVISNLNLDVKRGEIVAVVGSSGSGKSLLAHAILGLLPSNATLLGEMQYKGKPLTKEIQKQVRGKEIAFIPQSISYLDPSMKVEKQINSNGERKANKIKSNSIFSRLSLSTSVNKLYPFQLSGGMARRVLVCTALMNEVDFIIADEPTPGMHLEAAKEALTIFRELANEGKSILLITHDIDLAVQVADRVAVFYAGTTLELVSASCFTGKGEQLRHPYSKALWNSLPQNGFQPIGGSQPYPKELPRGCLFSPRCSKKTRACEKEIPMKQEQSGFVRCLYATGSN